MSLTSSFIAVPGSRDEFLREFLAIWKRLRLEESSPELSTFDEMYAWCEPRSGYLKGKHPSDTQAFTQDGCWAVMLDFSLLLSADDAELAFLSERFGTAVTFSTQGTAAHAGFRLFEGGRLRREISNNAGEVTTTGSPIAEEQGIGGGRQFYLAELYALQGALGFSFDFPDKLAGQFVAVRVVDTTEYPAPAVTIRRRPWWKIW